MAESMRDDLARRTRFQDVINYTDQSVQLYGIKYPPIVNREITGGEFPHPERFTMAAIREFFRLTSQFYIDIVFSPLL